MLTVKRSTIYHVPQLRTPLPVADTTGQTKAFIYPVMDHWGEIVVVVSSSSSSSSSSKVVVVVVVVLVVVK